MPRRQVWTVAVLFALTPAVRGDEPRASRLAEIGRAAEIGLADTEGRVVRLEDLRGKAVLVSFIYTTCGGVCPATTHRLYRAQEALKDAGLWGEKVVFVSISLDPVRDTPEVLRRYASAYDADAAGWRFVTGPRETVEAVVQAWGMWARTNSEGVLDHPSRIFLVDPAGVMREIYSLDYLQPDDVVADVREVLGCSNAQEPHKRN
jgi:protein SCO1/2